MTDDRIDVLEVAFDRPPSRWRGRLIALVGVAALIAAGLVVAANANGSDESPSDDATPPPQDESAPIEVQDVDAAGRYDGLDSVQLPLEVTPDDGLIDGQAVRARGTGFSPHATVAIIQCAGLGGDGSADNCDLSNYQLGNANEDGFVDMELIVHRYISNGGGELDCAAPDTNCAVAIGNIADYDESGVANVWFDGNVEGVRSPFISVDPFDGVNDGDTVTVTGGNFVPGDTVTLSQCVIGGSYSFGSCFSEDLQTGTVVVAADGTFSAPFVAHRDIPSRGIDCYTDPYGCRVAATGTTDAPNPVRIYFDGSIGSEPSYSLDPSGGLVDGSVVRLDVFGMPSDGTYAVAQCADGGPRGEFCSGVGVITIAGGVGAADLTVVQIVTNGDDTIDCAEPARSCFIRLEGDLVDVIRGPLRFAA